MPLAPNAFEAFLKVPKYLRPHTQIYCTRYVFNGHSKFHRVGEYRWLVDYKWYSYFLGPSYLVFCFPGGSCLGSYFRNSVGKMILDSNRSSEALVTFSRLDVLVI